MPLLKLLKSHKTRDPKVKEDDRDGIMTDDRRDDTFDPQRNEQEEPSDLVKMVYFTVTTLKPKLLEVLQSLTKDTVQSFSIETDCVGFIQAVKNKVFLIIDGAPSSTFIESIDPLKQIDSVFVFSPTVDSTTIFKEKQRTYLVNWCESESLLIDSIRRSRDELEKQTQAFSMYNKKEKATRDLSKEAGSFLFFQLFKTVLKNMPKTNEAKKTMVNTCRNYYRGNLTELANIDEFDRTYRSADAIPWYTKETFVYKFINKALRTEDVDVLYQFRFYIMDLSEQLDIKYQQLKQKQEGPLKLYRGLKLAREEVENFQRSIGNLISTNGYLSTSSDRAVAYGFASKAAKREGVVRALFEYEVDLATVQNIVIADIREFSAFPEEAEVLVDIGASFQIDSCELNPTDGLYYIKVHATDQGAALAAEYMEYQKKKMAESNIVLMFGNLLLEMGEYAKAERYFDTILSSSNPNDEEIACIFFNFGRTHRLKGDFNRAIQSYNRAYDLHMNARPKRAASAAKTLNGLGVVFSEQGKQRRAEDCFLKAMKIYKRAVPKTHIDVAATLINLGVIDCDRGEYEEAKAKFLRAKKIYDSSLPDGHPNRAMPRINLGNVYLAEGEYDLAREEYENALKLQEQALPADHPDVARTLHNLAVVCSNRHDIEKAKEYLERAEETASHMLSAKHPLMILLKQTKNQIVITTDDPLINYF